MSKINGLVYDNLHKLLFLNFISYDFSLQSVLLTGGLAAFNNTNGFSGAAR